MRLERFEVRQNPVERGEPVAPPPPPTKLSATIREAGGGGSAKSARRAAAICRHMLSFLSQSDHYGPIGNKQMSSSAWQSTMMNNHGRDGVTRVAGAPGHRDKVTQGDGGAADQSYGQEKVDIVHRLS